MQSLAEAHPGVRRIDGRGLHWTIRLFGPAWQSWHGQESEPLASRVAALALAAGALIATSGEQTSLFVAPPLIASEEEINLIFDALDHVWSWRTPGGGDVTDDSRESAPPSVESSSSVGKALHILSLFGPERPEWGASEVARELSVTVPTAHRLLNVLTHHGFLARFGRGRFRLGLEAISLGRRALALSTSFLLRSDLRELAAAAGETALLTVPEEHVGASLCIDRVESSHPLRLSLDVGRLTPLHAGASAKCCSPTSVRTTSSRCSVDRSAARARDHRRSGHLTSRTRRDPGAWVCDIYEETGRCRVGGRRASDRRTASRLPRSGSPAPCIA